MTDDVTLTDDECGRIVQASINPARVLSGPEGYDGGPPDVLLTTVSEIIAAREAGLRAEVERLARWKAEALPVIAGLQELGRALGVPLGERITGPRAVEVAEALVAERDRLRQDCTIHLMQRHEVEAERDRLAAQVEAVRGLECVMLRPEGARCFEVGVAELLWCGTCRAIAALDQDGGE